MRSSVVSEACPVSLCMWRETLLARLYGRSDAPSVLILPARAPMLHTSHKKKQRACEQLQCACPSSQILRQLYRYSFCPVLGFKNSLPLFLKLLKLNICVIELAMPSKEP